MGKAQIISNLGDGQYTVSISQSDGLLQSRLAWLNARYSALESARTPLEADRDAKLAELAVLRAELNVLIESHGPGNDLTAGLASKTSEIISKQTEITLLHGQIAGMSAQLASISKYRSQLQIIDSTDDIRTVWCADLSLDLAGEVKTIEINGVSDDILLLPTVHPDVSSIDTGELAPVLPMTPAQAAFNFAIHPGWQKWLPTFRAGTITALTGDIATVTLDVAVDRYQDLGINQTASVTATVKYMTCNGFAFTVGDDVVVSFTGQNWADPVVVGFQENPVECCLIEPFEADDSTGWEDLVPIDNIISDSFNWEYQYREYSHPYYYWNNRGAVGQPPELGANQIEVAQIRVTSEVDAVIAPAEIIDSGNMISGGAVSPTVNNNEVSVSAGTCTQAGATVAVAAAVVSIDRNEHFYPMTSTLDHMISIVIVDDTGNYDVVNGQPFSAFRDETPQGNYLFFGNKLFWVVPEFDDGYTSQRTHFLDLAVAGRPVSKIRFTADARQSCLPPNVTDFMTIYFYVTGLKDGDRYFFSLVVFNSRLVWPPYERVGCTDLTHTTTDWVESVSRSWWRGITHDSELFYDVPVSGVTVDRLSLVIDIYDPNGFTLMRGGAIVIDHIEVC